MPFSQKTLDFLFENRLNDSKEWYNEHKEDYKKYVIEPFGELIMGLEPTMKAIDENLMCNPKKISRIYRDTRFAKGKSIFRDDVWYSFRSGIDAERPLPEFYFDVSPAGFEYGCGFYAPGSETMDKLRAQIINGDKSFKKAIKAYESQSVFTLGGDVYKRNHYPEQSDRLCDWLNRKSLYLHTHSNDNDVFFSDRLVQKLADEYTSIAPIYHFFYGSSTD